MKEETAFFAKELFEDTAEKFGTNKFHIAGGSLRNFVEDGSKYPNDIDCFFGSDIEYFKAKESLEAQGYTVGKERANSVQMEKYGKTTYDLVFLAYVSDGKSIIDDFDFTNCCIAFGNEGLVVNENFFEDVRGKVLRLNNSKLPYHSIARAGKFMEKGYQVSDELKVQLFNNAAMSPYGPYQEDEYQEETVAVPQKPIEPFIPTHDDIPF